MLSTDAAHEITDVEFDADGRTLRGWLYRARRGAAVAPVVVMAHGYNCVKELYLDRYAAAVADTGRVVLAYDHRNFGESDGEPRQELNQWVQVRDYRNAITFVQTLDGVDAERIGVWGTSYAGGHVLVVAAIDRRVCAALSRRCRRLAAGSRRCGGSRRRRFLASATLGMRTALRATKASHRKWSKW